MTRPETRPKCAVQSAWRCTGTWRRKGARGRRRRAAGDDHEPAKRRRTDDQRVVCHAEQRHNAKRGRQAAPIDELADDGDDERKERHSEREDARVDALVVAHQTISTPCANARAAITHVRNNARASKKRGIGAAELQ